MNTQKNRDRLATELMGWESLHVYNFDRYAYYKVPFPDDEEPEMWVDDWNPFENWYYCGMVLDRLDEIGLEWQLRKFGTTKNCHYLMLLGRVLSSDLFAHPPKVRVSERCKKTTICNAVLDLITNHKEVLG